MITKKSNLLAVLITLLMIISSVNAQQTSPTITLNDNSNGNRFTINLNGGKFSFYSPSTDEQYIGSLKSVYNINPALNLCSVNFSQTDSKYGFTLNIKMDACVLTGTAEIFDTIANKRLTVTDTNGVTPTPVPPVIPPAPVVPPTPVIPPIPNPTPSRVLCAVSDYNGYYFTLDLGTSEFKLTKCDKSGTPKRSIIGTATTKIKGSTYVIKVAQAELNGSIKFDESVKIASGSFFNASGERIEVTDRNTANSTCGCPSSRGITTRSRVVLRKCKCK